jgi:serine/threonine protein kinase
MKKRRSGDKIDREFESLQARIERLKQAEGELDALEAPLEVFGAEIESIKSKLKTPSKVEEVEQELAVLKQLVSKPAEAPDEDAPANAPQAVAEPQETPPIGMLPELAGYDVLDRIGTGGFSDIHRARRKDGLVVALKIPRLSPFQTLVPSDFLREAELWSKLDHPYIVKTYEYGTKPYPWIAMEFMEGGSLRARIGRLSLRESLQIGVEMAQVLFYAHHHGVIHRDIKPENILFDMGKTPKLTDWGLGKMLLESSMTASGFKGTLAYSSPEQLSGSRFGGVDWRTDIYQLGTVLHEMLTGQKLFLGDEPGATITRILTEEPTAPSKLRQDIPQELDRIVIKAVARRKGERYQDVSALEEDLQAVLSHMKD